MRRAPPFLTRGDILTAHARNTNLMHVAGKLGGALSFNGTSDYINTNSSFQAIFSKDFSIADWFYWDLNNPNIGGYGVNNPATASCFITIENPNMEPISFLTELEYWLPGDKYLLLVSSGAFDESQWIFWAATISQQGNDISGKLYINGVLCDSMQLANANMSNWNCDKKFYLGAVNIDDSSIAYYDNKTHDNFMIFNKALSQDEISFLFNNGNGIDLDAETITPPTPTSCPMGIDSPLCPGDGFRVRVKR